MGPLEDAVLVLAHYKSREVTQIWTHQMEKEEKEATLEASPEVGSYLQENNAFNLFWEPNNIHNILPIPPPPPPLGPDKQTLWTKYKHNYHCSI